MNENSIEENVIASLPFSELLSDKNLLASLDAMGFTEATTVQTMAIPPVLAGKDVVVQASTGSGKTLAFGLPLVSILNEEIANGSVTDTFALVVTPTRELAVQIADVLGGLIEGINPALLIGGISYGKQKKALEEDARIVVGTPGRILDFLNQKFFRTSSVKYFVLDEADEMFSMGFFEDVEKLIRQIPEPAQGVFVSATISPRVVMLARKYLKEPDQIEASLHEEKPPEIEHLYVSVGSEVADKPLALCNLIEVMQPESAIVFCNRKSETELVESFLRRRGFDARRINSDLNQKQRNNVMERIRGNDLRYLIATDIAARGIDIAQIELVVNFAIPDATENYIHRTGRTGRAGRKGKAVSLISPHDFVNFQSLKRGVECELQEIPLPTDEEVAAARIVHLHADLTGALSKLAEVDRAVARQILRDFGEIDSSSDKLQDFVGVLARFVTENLVKGEAESLDEELTREDSSESRAGRDRRDESSQRGRRSGGRSGGRKDSRKRDRSR